MNIKDLVKIRRVAIGLSGRELAERVAVSHSYISQIERGLIKKPSPSVLKRLADVLSNTTVNELLVASGYQVEDSLNGSDALLKPIVGLKGAQTDRSLIEELIRTARSALQRAELLGLEIKQEGEMKIIPLFSTIPASFGTPLQDTINHYDEYETMKVLESKLNNDPHCFALRVKGDSMVGAGILPGDIVIVSPNTPYESGDICVVRINGSEHSIKRVLLFGDIIILQPANPKYDPIAVDLTKGNDLYIYGKVIYVERSLN